MKTAAVPFNIDDSAESLAALLRRLIDGGGLVTHPQLAFPDDLTVDLTDCGYLGPMAVVGLAVLRRVAEIQGKRVCIVPPSLDRLYNYCRYSGLLAEFGAGPPPDVGHPRNVTRPLAFFDTQTPRHDIGQIVQLAQSEMALTEAGKGDLKLTLGEVTQNVIDHSSSKVGGARRRGCGSHPDQHIPAPAPAPAPGLWVWSHAPPRLPLKPGAGAGAGMC